MFDIPLDNLKKDIDSIWRVLKINEKLRTIIETDPSQMNTFELQYIQENAPPSRDWRIYDHCSSVTRLYALYEDFVENLVAEWIDSLPKLYLSCEDLPESIKNTHRVGCADLLKDSNKRERFDCNIAEIARNLSLVEGNQKYKLISAAFLLHGQNLRKGSLETILNDAGISTIYPWDWIIKTPKIKDLMNGKVVETELKRFIDYRNEAAHGNVQEELGIDELVNLCDFIEALCQAIAELVMYCLVSRRIEIGKLKEVGEIIKWYKKPSACNARIFDKNLEKSKSLTIGKKIFLVSETKKYCQEAVIESIQAFDRNQWKDRRRVRIKDMEIGLIFAREASRELKIYMEI